MIKIAFLRMLKLDPTLQTTHRSKELQIKILGSKMIRSREPLYCSRDWLEAEHNKTWCSRVKRRDWIWLLSSEQLKNGKLLQIWKRRKLWLKTIKKEFLMELQKHSKLILSQKLWTTYLKSSLDLNKKEESLLWSDLQRIWEEDVRLRKVEEDKQNRYWDKEKIIFIRNFYQSIKAQLIATFKAFSLILLIQLHLCKLTKKQS